MTKQSAASGPNSNQGVAPLTDEQQAAVLATASELVASAVAKRTTQLRDLSLAGAASMKVDGVYVSLKRQGHLRGCCGFTGQQVSLMDGLSYSAARTALEDPRFPPVSSMELPYLDMEVWLLGGLIPVAETGDERVNAIKVGRDGLLIERGQQRGLLLPGVATDRDWDEETFLRQVCIKAQLPPTAWRETDTVLQRFEGTVLEGGIDETALPEDGQEFHAIVNAQSIEKLGQFCRENVRLMSTGALPNYYLQGVEDGMVNAIILTATWESGQKIWVEKKSLRPPIPLQSTLFGLCDELVKLSARGGADATTAQVELAVFEDPALHCTTRDQDLRCGDASRGWLLLGPGQAFGWQVDAESEPTEMLSQLADEMSLRPDQAASVISFHAHSTAPLQITHRLKPRPGADVRAPGVAGKFYPATANALSSMVRGMLPAEPPPKERWRAAMLPHAGLQYSGRIAAEVLAHLELPSSIVVMGPKHTRNGVDWAVAPHQTWSAPGIEIKNNIGLAEQLANNIDFLELDADAHAAEHCIEVELPFLAHYAPQSSVVGIALGTGSLEACRQFATGLAKTLKEADDNVLLLISSDMNHFASDAETRRLDELAMQAIETLDVERIFHTVRDHEISMCGLLPAVIVLDALNQIAPLKEAHRVRYATSADVSNDTSRVVGYAGMLFR